MFFCFFFFFKQKTAYEMVMSDWSSDVCSSDLDAIREDCGQTGTHIGCEHGVCGACTVIVGDVAVRSCLMFAVQARGKPIRTVEGLAKGNVLHPLQRAFMAHHGLQCGFCTPGFLMLTVNMLEKNPAIGYEELLDVLSSNLCRCTGYQNIVI